MSSCSGESESDALTFAEMLRTNIQALSIPNSGSSVGEYLTVSIDVASMSPNQKDVKLDTSFKIADKNLYMAKESGRNKVLVERR